ncbi:MAG: hypothetical protein ACLGH0_03530, partial [Thermoanaerobaculia bacterium]
GVRARPVLESRRYSVKAVSWVLAAALAAFACQLVITHATPIDRALPLLAVLATLLAALSYAEVMVAVPVLMVAEICIADETTRLLAFGLCVAAAATLIVLLRWIPFPEHLGRELFLLTIAVLIVVVLGRTPFAVLIGVITTLITPAIPLRTVALPVIVLIVALLARLFGMPRLQLRWVSAVVLGFVLLFFPWSGVVARAFPYFLKRAAPVVHRSAGADALPANGSVTLQVPEGTTSVIVSGANVARMKRGTPIGRIDDRVIRIGDVADWGYTRREAYYGARNPLPRDPAGRIRGYGYDAWLDGAGRIPLRPGDRTIVVTADAALPPGATLQVEGFE